MSDFSTINDFRKGRISRPNEDPTYLSFFFIFEWNNREESPLFAGPARDYLLNVIGGDVGQEYANRLDDFIKVLRKINTEMPWYWQSLSGLEGVREYGKMEDPYWGEKKLDITCLENVELTVSGLMDLYRRACYDFGRWVEVIPKNLRHFAMRVFVTEIRMFQQSIEARNISSRGENTSNLAGRPTSQTQSINTGLTGDAKPFFEVKLTFCEFDKNSGNNILSDLTKIAPEQASVTLSITYESLEETNSLYGNSMDLISNRERGIEMDKDPGDTLNQSGRLSNLSDAVTGFVDRGIQNIARNLGLDNPALGSVYGNGLAGAAQTAFNQLAENATGQLFLDNVYGANPAGSIQDAINTASINGIFNILNNQQGTPARTIPNDLNPRNIYPDTDNNQQALNAENVYPPRPIKPAGGIQPNNIFEG